VRSAAVAGPQRLSGSCCGSHLGQGYVEGTIEAARPYLAWTAGSGKTCWPGPGRGMRMNGVSKMV